MVRSDERVALLAVVALTGCNQVLGLHDFALEVVTGTVARDHVQNDPAGAPIVVADSLAPVTVSATDADGAALDVELDATTGALALRRPPGAPYAIVIEDETGPIEFHTSAPTLELQLEHVGRRDAQIAAPGTGVDVGTAAANGFPFAFIGGVFDVIASTTFNPGFAIDFSGHLLPDAAANDRIDVVRIETIANQYVVTSRAPIDVAVANGSVVSAVATFTATPADHCVALDAPNGTVLAQLATLFPTFTDTFDAWGVEQPFPTRPGLGFFALVSWTPHADDARDIHYPKLYDAGVGVEVRLGASRNVPTSRGSLSQGANFLADVPLAGTAMCEAMPALAIAAFPTTAALDGVAIVDNASIAIAASRVELAWTSAAGPRPDVTVVFLDRIDAGADRTNATRVAIRTYVTTESRLDLDPSVFVTGQLYQLDVAAVTGLAGAATGSFIPGPALVTSSWSTPPFSVAR